MSDGIPQSIIVPKSDRVVFLFEVPEEARADVGFTSIGMVALTMDEEQAVMNTMRGTQTGAQLKVQYDLAKKALREINGKTLVAIGEERDTAWSALTPQGRALVMAAYADIHSVSKEVSKGFLKGKTAVVR